MGVGTSEYINMFVFARAHNACCSLYRSIIRDQLLGTACWVQHLQLPARALLLRAAGSPCYAAATQVGCEKVTTGTVRRAIACLCFSQDGNWLFAGTASGDVLTVNVARRAVQVCAQLYATA